MLVAGRVGAGVAVGTGVTVGVGVGEELGLRAGPAATALLVTFAEQMTRASPPLAEPLHCVIVAPAVVAVAPGLRPMNSLEIWTLQRSVPPPPLIASLHWVTEVTGSIRMVVLVEPATCGSPVAP